MYKKNGVVMNSKSAPAPMQPAVNDKFVVHTTNKSMDEVLITPGIATFLLENHNSRNRPVKATRVDQYAAELILGMWKYNGERILFDRDGQMLSGQHRLFAIIKSGVSMLVDIKFGIDPNVRDTIDAGAIRSANDILRLTTGDLDTNFKGKVMNGVKKLLNHRRTATSAVFRLMMQADFERGLQVAMATVKNKNGLGRGPAVGAIAFAAEAYPRKVRSFIEDVIAGQATSSAAQKLILYVMNDFNGGRDSEDVIASKVLFAIDAHLTGNEDVGKLLTSRHEEIVEKYLAAIQVDHALATIKAVRPKPEPVQDKFK